LIGRNPVNLIVGWCGQFLFFVVPRQFSQDIGEWPQNQILIPDWTHFHCLGATLLTDPTNQLGRSFAETGFLWKFYSCSCLTFLIKQASRLTLFKWKTLIPNWTYFHCPGATLFSGPQKPVGTAPLNNKDVEEQGGAAVWRCWRPGMVPPDGAALSQGCGRGVAA